MNVWPISMCAVLLATGGVACDSGSDPGPSGPLSGGLAGPGGAVVPNTGGVGAGGAMSGGALQPSTGGAGTLATGGEPRGGGVAGSGGQIDAGSGPSGGMMMAGAPAGTGGQLGSGGTGVDQPGADPGFPDGDYYNPVVPCETGALEGSEIIIMGDSFYALSGEIERNLEALAAAAGAPSPYRTYAVSGSTLGGNAIPGQYDRALRAGPVKLVIMDGGGNDQYFSYCSACPGIVENMFSKMAENGTEDVLYTFYPDPGNPIGSASFKPFHDQLRLTIREACVKETGLRCHFLDLRPYWQDGDTFDGLHPTSSGARHVADAIWDFMQKDCLGQ